MWVNAQGLPAQGVPLSFHPVTGRIPVEKTGGRRDSPCAGPCVFPSPACPVMGKALRCPSPRPGTSGSVSLFTESSSPAPRTAQAHLTSAGVVYILAETCHLFRHVSVSCVFVTMEWKLYPVKGVAVIPVHGGKSGGRGGGPLSLTPKIISVDGRLHG